MKRNEIKKFFDVCFDPGDKVWVATRALLFSRCYAQSIESVCNQFQEKDVPGGIYLAVNAGEERRLIENVTKARTFLVEFDTVPLEDQITLYRKSGLPVTAVISSGGKSLHFWITLEQPLEVGEYQEWFLRMWLLLDKKNDRQCSDPCRYSRFPGAFRDGKEQTLRGVGKRVPNNTLKQLLFTDELNAAYEKMFSGRNQGGEVYMTGQIVPVEKAVSFLRDKYPLTTGQKQNNMLIWARYLCGSARVQKVEELCEIIEQNDQGKNHIHSEYERVAMKAVSAVQRTEVISDQIWSDA
jgi:hypothetical protein